LNKDNLCTADEFVRVETAEEAVERLARLQFDGCYSPYSALLLAELKLFPAELSLSQTRASNAAALATLSKAMDGGWVDGLRLCPRPSGHRCRHPQASIRSKPIAYSGSLLETKSPRCQPATGTFLCNQIS
jgi:hypothetical protein